MRLKGTYWSGPCLTYMIHAVIPTKYHKYLSITVLKHANVLDKINKLSYVNFLNTTPHDAYSITTHVLTMTISDTIHKQKE